MPQTVHHFRQILIWPLQVMPIREGSQIQEPWDILRNSEREHAWRELQDEFGCNREDFKERHYSEFVTFLPYVRNDEQNEILMTKMTEQPGIGIHEERVLGVPDHHKRVPA